MRQLQGPSEQELKSGYASMDKSIWQKGNSLARQDGRKQTWNASRQRRKEQEEQLQSGLYYNYRRKEAIQPRWARPGCHLKEFHSGLVALGRLTEYITCIQYITCMYRWCLMLFTDLPMAQELLCGSLPCMVKTSIQCTSSAKGKVAYPFEDTLETTNASLTCTCAHEVACVWPNVLKQKDTGL